MDWDSARTLLLQAGISSKDSQYILDNLSYNVDTVISYWQGLRTQLTDFQKLTTAKGKPRTMWQKLMFNLSRPVAALSSSWDIPAAGLLALVYNPKELLKGFGEGGPIYGLYKGITQGEIIKPGIQSEAEAKFRYGMGGINNTDSLYVKLKKFTGALSASEEQRNGYYRFFAETLVDPTTYIGFNSAVKPAELILGKTAVSKVASATPRLFGLERNSIGFYSRLIADAGLPKSIASLTNTFELALNDLIEHNIIGVKNFVSGGAKVGGRATALFGTKSGEVVQLLPKTGIQIAKTESRLGAMEISGYIVNDARHMSGKWLPDAEDLAASAIRAVEAAIRAPFDGGTAASIGKTIMKNFTPYFTKEKFLQWAGNMGVKVTKDSVTREELWSITNALGLVPGAGRVPRTFDSLSEVATHILSVITRGEGEITNEMIAKMETLIKQYSASNSDLAKMWIKDNMDRGGVKFTGRFYNLVYHDLMGFPKGNTPGKIDSDVFLEGYRTGISSFMLSVLDPKWLRGFRQSIEREITMPFAKSYLIFANYGPMNYLETWIKGGLSGGGWKFKNTWNETDLAQHYWGHLRNQIYDIATYTNKKSFSELWKVTPETFRVEMLNSVDKPVVGTCGRRITA